MPIMHPSGTLTVTQHRMYNLESEENFRWIAGMLGSESSYILTPADIAPESLQNFLAIIGQFAEAAHGSVDPEFVWANKEALLRKDFPLEGYNAVRGSELVKVIRGDVCRLQAIVVYRRQEKQLVVSLSGTCNFDQDVESRTNTDRKASEDCKVHTGFYRMFSGVLPKIGEELSKAFENGGLEFNTLVLTGHSLGGAMAILLAMDILQTTLVDGRTGPARVPPGFKVKVVAFGCPRAGNHGLLSLHKRLATNYREKFGEDSYEVHSVKGYNDGVPSLPPYFLGYRHLVLEPLYFFHGKLYRVPEAEMEHSFFPVEVDNMGVIAHPKGGHNYYNGRDMEKALRRLRCIDHEKKGWNGWEERYLEILKKGEI